MRRVEEVKFSFDARRRRLTSPEMRMTKGSQASTTLWSFASDLLSVSGLGGSVAGGGRRGYDVR